LLDEGKKRVQLSLRSAFAIVTSIACVTAAYARGQYLLGHGAGLSFGVMLLLLCVYALRLRSTRILGRTTFVMVSILVLLALIRPTYLSPNIQYAMDMQSDDRNARAELGRVFDSDPQFSELHASTKHLYQVHVQVAGTIPTRRDLERLRSRVFAECGFVDRCGVHWRVHVIDESMVFDGFGEKELTARKAGNFPE
ncbi:MAG: hypothetical protein QGG36_24295, partial [Pirellulaceae bacterium]|nr:hypothetical protein [Pirellulaceae bacterium]